MNLTIDAGNTSAKLVVFNKDKPAFTQQLKNLSVKDLKKIFSNYAIDHCILSSVVSIKKEILKYLESHSVFIRLQASTPVPVKNKYKTPATLGSDRLASVIGAASLFPTKNILVIDAGTCMKYDFINSKKEYFGGSISPGLNMRFEALHNFTDQLPLIQPTTITRLTGTSTKESILTGVQTGMIHEINGFIEQYKKHFPSLIVVMTGGDASLFVGHIKSSIFAAPNLIHVGLHEILKYHVEQL